MSEVLDIWTCPIVATLLQSELGVNSSVKEERGRGAEHLCPANAEYKWYNNIATLLMTTQYVYQ